MFDKLYFLKSLSIIAYLQQYNTDTLTLLLHYLLVLIVLFLYKTETYRLIGVIH